MNKISETGAMKLNKEITINELHLFSILTSLKFFRMPNIRERDMHAEISDHIAKAIDVEIGLTEFEPLSKLTGCASNTRTQVFINYNSSLVPQGDVFIIVKGVSHLAFYRNNQLLGIGLVNGYAEYEMLDRSIKNVYALSFTASDKTINDIATINNLDSQLTEKVRAVKVCLLGEWQQALNNDTLEIFRVGSNYNLRTASDNILSTSDNQGWVLDRNVRK